jgi:PadR family transcriptional regulator PadR
MKDSSHLQVVQAQMRKGILEFCILLIISKKSVYASEILTILSKAKLIVVEGTLYPLLSRLKREELLSYNWVESKSGPPRKYYKLSKKGKNLLSHLTKTWESLSKSIYSLTNTHG